MDNGLETAGGKPAAGLLIDHLPRREVGGQIMPWCSASDELTQGVEDVAEVVDSLAGIFREQANIRENELSFGIGDVAGVGLVRDHALNYVRHWTTVHSTL